MNKEFKCDTRILSIAAHYFLLFSRKVPFTEFPMFLGAAMAHYIATKVEYRHPKIAEYERFFHERAPKVQQLSKLKGKKAKTVNEAKQKSFEEVQL